MRILAVILAGMVLVLVSVGCTRGVAEFQAYSVAFETQYAEGDRVIDRMAQAERQVWRAEYGEGGRFNPNEAAYYLNLGDPPLASALRASFKALRDYNLALGALASGESGTTLTSRVTAMVGNVTDARANFAQALAGPAVLSGAVGAMTGATQALDIVIPAFNQIAAHASREEFRRRFVATYPQMKALLMALRGSTPEMYDLMRASYLREGLPTAADTEALARDKALLAGWVILLDATLKAMDSAALSAMSQSSDIDLEMLTQTSIELRILSEQLKAERLKP
ncbi:MAG: hypothetical protein WBA73_15205 [Devosia sp.]